MTKDLKVNIALFYDGKQLTPRYEFSHELPPEEMAFLADFIRDHIAEHVRKMKPIQVPPPKSQP